jgi:hypothetical protein
VPNASLTERQPPRGKFLNLPPEGSAVPLPLVGSDARTAAGVTGAAGGRWRWRRRRGFNRRAGEEEVLALFELVRVGDVVGLIGDDRVGIDVVVLANDLRYGIAVADLVEDAVLARDDDDLVPLDEVRVVGMQRRVVGKDGRHRDAVAGGDTADRIAALGAVFNDGATRIDDIGQGLHSRTDFTKRGGRGRNAG